MKFREHRGGFEESMATAKEFSSMKELLDCIAEQWNNTIVALHMKYYGIDDRNNWDTFLVLADFKGLSPNCPVGWLDVND